MLSIKESILSTLPEGWSDDYDSVARAAEAAIKRLGVEQLDLVQLHCIPTDTLKASKAFTSLEKTKEAGLIQHYGVSIETIEEGLFCIKESEAVSLQVIFNIFRQRVSDELLPAAQESNTAIIARVPLASGLLTGKFSDNHQFHPEDHRHFNANGELFNVGETFAGVPFATGVEHAQKIEALLLPEDSDKPLAQKALRWILDHEAISTVIPGAKNSTQVDDHLAASAMAPLSDQAHQNLSELYASNIDSSVRGAY